MIKIILVIVILLLVIRYQSIIYHYTISFPRLYYWLSQNNRKAILDEKVNDILTIGNMEEYFDSFPKNEIIPYYSPLFDNALLLKKDIQNIFHQDNTSKENSLPYLINMFTTPHSLLGTWLGDSIFRTDYHKRGENNRYKEVYMEALKQKNLENYRNVIIQQLSKYLDKPGELSFFDFCQNINIELTYLIHFGFLPSKEDYKGSIRFINAVKDHAIDYTSIHKQILNLPGFYQRTLNYIRNTNNETTMIGVWNRHGKLSKESIFMEFIHNILGMAINWTNLTYLYIKNHSQGIVSNIPKDEEMKKAYIYECFRFLLPVRFTGSHINKPEEYNLPNSSNNIFIHDLKVYTQNPNYFGSNPEHFLPQRMENHLKDTVSSKGKCPFSGFFETPNEAKVVCGMELFEKEGYLPFGYGYRRCPGEHLSMIFLEEMANKMASIKYKVYLDGETNPERYIWGEVDKNLKLKISQS